MTLLDSDELARYNVELLFRSKAPPLDDALLFVKLQLDNVALQEPDSCTAPPHLASLPSKFTLASSSEELLTARTPPPKDPPLFPTKYCR